MANFDGDFVWLLLFLWLVGFFFNHDIKQVRNINVKSLPNKRKQITYIICTLSCPHCRNAMKSHPLS